MGNWLACLLYGLWVGGCYALTKDGLSQKVSIDKRTPAWGWLWSFAFCFCVVSSHPHSRSPLLFFLNWGMGKWCCPNWILTGHELFSCCHSGEWRTQWDVGQWCGAFTVNYSIMNRRALSTGRSLGRSLASKVLKNQQINIPYPAIIILPGVLVVLPMCPRRRVVGRPRVVFQQQQSRRRRHHFQCACAIGIFP